MREQVLTHDAQIIQVWYTELNLSGKEDEEVAFNAFVPEWLRPSQKESAVKETHTGGRLTGCSLEEIDSLLLPFVRDPFYRLRPVFSHQAARLSLELAQLTYTLDLEPWQQAGWNDFSIQIDNTLHSGLTYSKEKEGMQAFLNQARVYLAKAVMTDSNPVSQVIGALRQKEGSDTLKAVTMIHSLEDDTYLLAIGFMGTGKRILDWFSNLRITTKEGFHKGFYQLCTHFEDGLDQIVFPATAAELGLETLTLRHIIEEMSSGSSRFRLWMAGHSQGSAVMQIFSHRLINRFGVLPQNMVGYGFASPTVATGRLVYDPACYPLYHILNKDDLVPNAGALVHLGLCLEYASTPGQREETYDMPQNKVNEDLFSGLLAFRKGMQDGPSTMVRGWAMIRALQEMTDDGQPSDRRGLQGLWDQALNYAGKTAAGWLDSALKYLENSYQEMTGRKMPEQEKQKLVGQAKEITARFPLISLMEAFIAMAVPPHRIAYRGKDGAYAFVVKYGLGELQPFIWVKQKGSLPYRRYAPEPMQEHSGSVPFHSLPVRQKDKAVLRRNQRGILRKSYSFQKKR